jgi:hypothetical protein
MSTHITVRVGGKSANRNGDQPSHDDNHEPAGWSKPREPKDEPPAKSLSLNPGKWTSQASARSGPTFAPGMGETKKSS